MEQYVTFLVNKSITKCLVFQLIPPHSEKNSECSIFSVKNGIE